MKNIILFCALTMSAIFAFAKMAPVIETTDARIFAPIKGSNATAGYLTIKNVSKKPVTLTITKAAPFKAVEMHETVEKDGRMSMQKMDQLTIEPGHGLELKQGGNHIMFFDAAQEIKVGESVKVGFTVNGKPEEIDFKVIPRVQKKEDIQHH